LQNLGNFVDNNKTHPKGVDELNQNVVAQENVTMTSKSKATFRLPIVRLFSPFLQNLGNFVGMQTALDT